jgi:hypothetical protein
MEVLYIAYMYIYYGADGWRHGAFIMRIMLQMERADEHGDYMHMYVTVGEPR